MCSVEGCADPHYAKELCQKHYARVRATGSTELRPRKRLGPCKVEGCSEQSIARNLCPTHYQRWKRLGDVGPAPKLVQRRDAECSVDGCAAAVYAKTWCVHHYENNRQRGNPLAEGRGRKWRVGESKWVGKTCIVEGCDRPARTRGYCTLHYDRMQRFGEPGPIGLMVGKYGDGYIDAHGYRVVPREDGGRILEHRLVMEQTLGRPLRGNENVHHRNGRRDDNRPQNLELWVKSQPCGQRVVDLVAWAKEIIDTYGAEAQREKRRRKTL